MAKIIFRTFEHDVNSGDWKLSTSSSISMTNEAAAVVVESSRLQKGPFRSYANTICEGKNTRFSVEVTIVDDNGKVIGGWRYFTQHIDFEANGAWKEMIKEE